MKTGFLAAIILSLALSLNARAADNSWTDGSGKWETSNNWSRLLRPSTSDSANFITNATTKTVTIDSTTSGFFPASMTISNLTVSAPLNSTNTLSLNNAGLGTPLDVLNSFTIASGGVLLITTNSVLSVDGVSGGSVAVNGTVVLNSGSIIATNQQTSVGSSGLGQMAVFSGTVQMRNVIVGVNSSSQGSLTVAGGTMLVSSNLLIGSLSNSVGTVNLPGGALYVTNAAHSAVTEVRRGTLTLNTGGVFVTDSLVTTNAGGSFVNNGGTFTLTGQAQFDQGTQTFASGTSVLSSNFAVGNTANSTGAVNVTGGSLVATNASTVIASNGVGSVTVSSNATLLTALTSLAVGSNSTASLTVQDIASMTVLSNLTAGSGVGSTALLSFIGGTAVVTQGVIGIGNNGTLNSGSGFAQMTIQNASVTAKSVLLGSSVGGHGVMTIKTGGTLHIAPAQGCAACGLSVNDGILDGGVIDSPDAPFWAGQTHPGEFIISNGVATFLSGYVGFDNLGTLTQAGGTLNVLSNLTVGTSPGATGIVAMSGGSMFVTDSVFAVGNDGTVTSGSGVGYMTISNATVSASTFLLGSSAGGHGELTLGDGGSVSSAGTNAILVCNGFGQIGGDLSWTNIGSAMYCGYAHPGAYVLSNGTSSCQDLYVGYDNAGTMTIAGGAMTILSRLTVGQLSSPPSTGAVWIAGGQLTMTNNYSIIGNSGVGQMTISNGTVMAGSMVVGNGSNPGSLTVAGGTMTVLSNLTVGNCGGAMTGIVTITGGALYVTNAAHNAVLDVRSGTFMITGGAIVADTLVMTNACGRFLNLGGSVTITTKLLDPNLSADGDGIPNGWKQRYGLDPFDPNLGSKDPDGDGFSNLQEYLAGTDPNDPNSTPLRITAVARENNNFRVTWSTFAGTTNIVQVTSGAANGDYTNNFGDIAASLTIVVGSGETSTNYVEPGGAANTPARYYRIRLVP